MRNIPVVDDRIAASSPCNHFREDAEEADPVFHLESAIKGYPPLVLLLVWIISIAVSWGVVIEFTIFIRTALLDLT